MQQVHDFHAESKALSDLLKTLSNKDWARPTQFKGWTVNDVLVHLHFWNLAADLSFKDPNGFMELLAQAWPAIQQEGMRPFENAYVRERGHELFATWNKQVEDMVSRWDGIDEKRRMKWAGPDMSARSMMTARQMETWAHGQEVFDLFGQIQPQSDRVRNIVFLGVNTFGWAHQVHGQSVPASMPELRLTAPSGALWTFGETGQGEVIEGSAVEFAQVVTQTRHIADTKLSVKGPVAKNWMQIAQCFAGPPETPPAPGTRFQAT